MTTGRWLLCCLVLALALFGAGWWAGSRPIDPGWQARTDSLLGVQRKRYDDSVYRLTAAADSMRLRGDNMATIATTAKVSARQTEEAARRLRDRLAVLASGARSAADSLLLLPGKDSVIALQDTALIEKDSAFANLESALTVSRESNRTLRNILTVDSARISDLTRQLTTAPVSRRRGFLGFAAHRCAFAGMTQRGLGYGVGVCLTR